MLNNVWICQTLRCCPALANQTLVKLSTQILGQLTPNQQIIHFLQIPWRAISSRQRDYYWSSSCLSSQSSIQSFFTLASDGRRVSLEEEQPPLSFFKGHTIGVLRLFFCTLSPSIVFLSSLEPLELDITYCICFHFFFYRSGLSTPALYQYFCIIQSH